MKFNKIKINMIVKFYFKIAIIIFSFIFLSGCAQLLLNGKSEYYKNNITYYYYNEKSKSVYPGVDPQIEGSEADLLVWLDKINVDGKIEYKMKHIIVSAGITYVQGLSIVTYRNDEDFKIVAEKVKVISKWLNQSYEERERTKNTMNEYLAKNGLNDHMYKDLKDRYVWRADNDAITKEGIIITRSTNLTSPNRSIALNKRQLPLILIEPYMLYKIRYAQK
ncbi:hypothetical protein [Wohlfahrtiimonas larvae]|uniref:Lipoprotein n=1 Tax=Wohlfahrtiimonas larvae TaxID=1157986 RepID=A0ABP9MXC3_9GAMM|nr:hypothetical protein [Wohlfahrtiimonas larvae]